MRKSIFLSRWLRTYLFLVLSISWHLVSAGAAPAPPRTFHVPGPESYASIHGICWVEPNELWITRSDKMNAPVYLEIWDADKMVRKTTLRPPGFVKDRFWNLRQKHVSSPAMRQMTTPYCGALVISNRQTSACNFGIAENLVVQAKTTSPVLQIIKRNPKTECSCR